MYFLSMKEWRSSHMLQAEDVYLYIGHGNGDRYLVLDDLMALNVWTTSILYSLDFFDDDAIWMFKWVYQISILLFALWKSVLLPVNSVSLYCISISSCFSRLKICSLNDVTDGEIDRYMLSFLDSFYVFCGIWLLCVESQRICLSIHERRQIFLCFEISHWILHKYLLLSSRMWI